MKYLPFLVLVLAGAALTTQSAVNSQLRGGLHSVLWAVLASYLVGTLAAALVLAPRRWRPVAGGLALAYAVSLSANRIVFGGRFLSDVLLSWAVTALVLALLYRGLTVASAARRRRTFRALSIATA